MIQALTPADSPADSPPPAALPRPRRYRLRLPFRLRPLDYSSVLVHATPASELEFRASRVTPHGLTEAEILTRLNTLDADGLSEIGGISMLLACQIVKVRNRDGLFTELDQLGLVPGLGPARFARLFGRESNVEHERLRLFLRLPSGRDLTPREFQPLDHQLLPPGLRRVFFAPGAGPEQIDRSISKSQRTVLRVRKIADWRLFLHLEAEAEHGDRLASFLKSFPAFLRNAVLDGGFLKPPHMKLAESRAPFRLQTVSGLSKSVYTL